MEDEDRPGDPFTDFINSSLDMEGIDGLDQAAIAEKVRRHSARFARERHIRSVERAVGYPASGDPRLP